MNPRSLCLRPARPTLALLVITRLFWFSAPAAEFVVGPADHEPLQAAMDAGRELDPREAGDPRPADRGADQSPAFIAGDIEVFLPRISVFAGVSFGNNGEEDFEVAAVGPQEDLPDQWEAMTSGEFSVVGAFVSIGTPQLVGFYELRLLPSSPPGSGNLVISWPTTVRAVSVQATTNLGRPDSWTTLSVPQENRGEMTSVTLPLGERQSFFRLRY